MTFSSRSTLCAPPVPSSPAAHVQCVAEGEHAEQKKTNKHWQPGTGQAIDRGKQGSASEAEQVVLRSRSPSVSRVLVTTGCSRMQLCLAELQLEHDGRGRRHDSALRHGLASSSAPKSLLTALRWLQILSAMESRRVPGARGCTLSADGSEAAQDVHMSTTSGAGECLTKRFTGQGLGNGRIRTSGIMGSMSRCSRGWIAWD